MPDPQLSINAGALHISRKSAPRETEERLQKSEAGPAEATVGEIPDSLNKVLLSPGQPLDRSSRAYFEPRFGHDLSQVRVHSDAAAEQSAREVNAHAYTVGHTIVFGAGKFAPGTYEGRQLLAHELTHVVQSTDDPSVVRRLVTGDIRTQTITPNWAKALTDSELQQQAEIATQELAKLPPDSGNRQALSANLALLEEEASLRGVVLPAATAYALLNVIGPLANDLAQLQATLKTAGATQLGFGGPKWSDVIKSMFQWGEDQLFWTTNALGEARNLINQAKAGGPQSHDKFRAAGTRFTAALFGAQALAIYISFVQTGTTGKTYVPGMSTEHIIVRVFGVTNKLDPTVKELKSLDAGRVEAAASGFSTVAKPLVNEYQTFIDEFEKAAVGSAKFMKFYAAYQIVLAAIAGFRMVGGFGGGAAGAASTVLRLPGIGGITASGAATGINIAISAEWLEMIKRLGMIGAISIGATGSIVGLAYPGQVQVPGAAFPHVLLRATPSGTVTPSKGPDVGRSVSYGDSRAKHTKLADHTMQEMKDATANPSAAPADLQTLNQKVGDATYGSQLSKEAADNYATLVQDALENGARTSAARVDYTAQYEVGINIINGQPTKNYTMFFSNAYGGWHIFPR